LGIRHRHGDRAGEYYFWESAVHRLKAKDRAELHKRDIMVPIVVAVIAMLEVVLVASYGPGRRATRIDPVAALRSE
jgi:hypothetical protein